MREQKLILVSHFQNIQMHQVYTHFLNYYILLSRGRQRKTNFPLGFQSALAHVYMLTHDISPKPQQYCQAVYQEGQKEENILQVCNWQGSCHQAMICSLRSDQGSSPRRHLRREKQWASGLEVESEYLLWLACGMSLSNVLYQVVHFGTFWANNNRESGECRTSNFNSGYPQPLPTPTPPPQKKKERKKKK